MSEKQTKPNFEKGITLIELIVVIFVITAFSLITINNFPKIKRQFAISRATHRLAQNLRKTEDLGLSGVQVSGVSDARGYGFYINPTDATQYLIYADIADATETADHQYTGNYEECGSEVVGDCIVELISILDEEPDVYIKGIYNADTEALINTGVSINFAPPNPTVTITTDAGEAINRIEIDLSLNVDQSEVRKIFVNSSGLVETE